MAHDSPVAQPSPQDHAHHSGLFHHPRFFDLFWNLATLGRADSLRRAALDAAGLRSGGSALDAGSGTGSLALLAKRRVGPSGHVVGVDASSAMIEASREKAGTAGVEVRFLLGSVDRLDLPSGSLDVVLTSYVLHHVPEPAQTAALGEFYRVLKPGGRLVLVDMDRSRMLLGKLLFQGAAEADAPLLATYGERMRRLGFERIEPVPLPSKRHQALRGVKPS